MCYNNVMKLNIIKSLNLKHSIQNTISTIKKLGNSDICVIVPDKLSATMEQTLFEQLQIESSFNINVSTLNRLSKNILAETKAKYKSISKIGGIILLKKVLNANKELVSSFKNNNYSYQYSNEIYKTLAQLKACQISSAELINYKCNTITLQQKINDLGYLLELYNNAKVGMLDNSDTLTLTCMMLSQSQTVKNTYYIFAGFDDFTSQGFNLIEQLMSFSKGVYINTYTSNSRNKNIYCKEVLHKLILLCNTIGADYDLLDMPYQDDDLHQYLTNDLFSFNKLNYIVNSNDIIRLYQAQNTEDELEYIARDIRSKIIDGARYREFGIAVYGLACCADSIKRIFNKYELCTYIDIQKTFSSTCVYSFFTNLWQLYLKNYDTLNLIEFINSPFIIIPDAHKQFIIQTISKLDYRGNLANLPCDNDEICVSIKHLSTFLDDYKLTSNSAPSDVISWHNNIVEQLNMQSIVDNIINSMTDAYEQKILAQSIKSSTQLLNEILTFYPESTLEQFADIYTQAGLELSISPLPLSADCIQVIDAGEILTTFDHLYIVNCCSSTSPNVLQDIGILLDNELSSVQLSHGIEPSIAKINRLNKFKLFNNALMFNKSLCITMSLSSISETACLVNELSSRIMISDNNQLEANIEYIYPQSCDLNTYSPLSLWDLIEYVYTNQLEITEDISNIIKCSNILINNKSVQIDKGAVAFDEISASALETYFQCPFKYFADYVLKLKQPISSDIEMLDIGNILHELAYKYYMYKDRNSLDIHKFCHDIINNMIQHDDKLHQHINNPILVNLISEAIRFITHLQSLDNNSLFKPTYFEKPFGNNHAFKSYPLTPNVSLKGKVDRVDIYNDYFRIIDYKSGNADASLAELYYGKKLQLFLYASAVANAMNKNVSGTFYLPIQNVLTKSDDADNVYKLTGFYTDNEQLIKAYDINLQPNDKSRFVNMSLKKDGSINKRSDKILTPNDMGTLLNYAKEVSVNALKEIKQGIFAPSPLKFDSMHAACTYCPYLSLCSKASNNINYRNISKVTKDSFTGGSDE